MRKTSNGNMWAVTVTLDQATVDRLKSMKEDTGASLSASIRKSVEERYNHLYPSTSTAPGAVEFTKAIYGDQR
jgi:Ribbon-helix-helix protein, copG family